MKVISVAGFGQWVKASDVDASMTHFMPVAGEPVRLFFPSTTLLMLSAIVRILAFANQLSAAGHRVELCFEAGSRAHGYLGRVGFFERLDDAVIVQPDRPHASTFSAYKGRNDGVEEIAAVRHGRLERGLPDRVIAKLVAACAAREDMIPFKDAASTIVTELIGNVHDHSETELDGFVALQRYAGGNKVSIVVSDSGRGLVSTLRPALERRDRTYAGMSDADILLATFSEGLSRHENSNRGCGLQTCARRALSFRGEMEVRLATQRIFLSPIDGRYASAETADGLAPLRGTQIFLDFALA